MTLAIPENSRLTLDEIREIWFQPARLGHRGLDPAPVRAFCLKVEQELTRLLEEKKWLAREVERLRTPGPAAEPEADHAHIYAVRILAKAQQTADQYVADAQEYSRQLAEDARRRRDEIVTEARTSAARIIDDAHDAATKAAAIPLSAPAATPTGVELQKMQAELAYLRTFSEVCRTHLRAYLEALVRNVDEWERMEKKGFQHEHLSGS